MNYEEFKTVVAKVRFLNNRNATAHKSTIVTREQLENSFKKVFDQFSIKAVIV